MEHLIEIILTMFWFIVTISVVVFLHEGGHFFFARKFGVGVETFSIGFGKELFGWNDRYGTRWKVSLIPMGGYVKMFGDANPASAPDFEKINGLSEEEKSKSFYFKPLWQKAMIVGAGPLANYLTAIIIFTGMFFSFGKAVMSPEIGSVVTGSAAEKAGIEIGDIVTSVDGKNIKSFNELKENIILNTGSSINLEVMRDSRTFNIKVTPEIKEIADKKGNKIKMAMLGIASRDIEHVSLNLFESAYESLKQTYSISASMLKGIWQILSGQRGSEEIGGPVKIASYSKESAEAGLGGVLWFIALISINLGLINLFPVPLLDGGHLLYYAIEGLKGKPLSATLQAHGFKIGIVVLASLMIFAIFNDIKFLLGK
ncbi:RIP metalloprotease RseP [Candidatus Jidaibacter acanthamoebae]|nr:RIP metalloprotease RseP [Candidatus Jidaibacter acanthamoeba]